MWAAHERRSRVTPLGRFLRRTRLDELPQLWNVLRGDMSLVGPRPERPEFVEQLTEQIPFYGQRHVVRPGLTGWAQVRYTYGASVEDALEKLQYDLFYIKNLSIALDLFIIFETVKTVVLRERGVTPGSDGSNRAVNAMTIDVEDYFTSASSTARCRATDGSRRESRVCANTERLLEIFDEHGVRATFFVLGWVAERFPALVPRIAAAGHEIASQSAPTAVKP